MLQWVSVTCSLTGTEFASLEMIGLFLVLSESLSGALTEQLETENTIQVFLPSFARTGQALQYAIYLVFSGLPRAALGIAEGWLVNALGILVG